MIYEIENIEPADDDDGVLVTVSYWYEDSPGKGNPRRPKREPDFTEEHLILGVPVDGKTPVRTPLGQFVGLDGSPVSPWRVVDGELVTVDAEDIKDEIQWIDSVSADRLIFGTIDNRAEKVFEQVPRGKDKFRDHERPGRHRRAQGRGDNNASSRAKHNVGRLRRR